MMTATHNRLFLSLVGLAIGWTAALRALSELGVTGTLLGIAFLATVVWAVLRASRI